MALSKTQIDLVKQSFELVGPITEQAAELFYNRLFELDPSLRALFHGNMKEQGRKLMTMLALVVHSLDHLDALIPAAKALGKRHVGYGVKAEHYATVGAALLWTLEQGLGVAFTEEVKAAWTTTYGLLVETIIQDAYAVEPV